MTSTIAVVSDTHGLFREEVVPHLSKVELILHAGDVGGASILDRLRESARVVAIRGNTDHDPFGKSLPQTEHVTFANKNFYLIHNLENLDLDPQKAGIDVVIFGHTHVPESFRKQGVLYLNPGSIGPVRGDLPVSLALLRVSPDGIQVSIKEL